MYGLDELPPCDVEPNVFYEPLSATAPFVIVYECGDKMFPNTVSGDTIRTFSSRAEAEAEARELSTSSGLPNYVLGTVSISSVPKPLPVKASTRALV